MKKLLVASALLAAVVFGFAVTYFAVDPDGGASSASGFSSTLRAKDKIIQTLVFAPGISGAGEGVTRTDRSDGLEIASSFDKAVGAQSPIGATYVNLDKPGYGLPASGHFRIEIDATLTRGEISSENPQKIEVRFVQNGFRVLDWQQQVVGIGRQAYVFDYNSASDPRTGPKVDTVWIRSDSDGRGRPVTLHALRIIASEK